MDYTRLQNLRNTYPAVANTDVSAYYSNNGSYITRYGLDKKNVYVNYDNFSLETLQVLNPQDYPYVDFSFIVQFQDEETGTIEEWTSAPFKKLLEEAAKENNPYFNRYSVAVIPLNFTDLKNHHKRNKLVIGEKYAEVEVTKTISTIEDMLLHIQWLTVFTDQFRNTTTGIRINDPKYPIDGIGKFISKHNPTGTFGFEWDTLFKKALNDKVFAEEIAKDSLVSDTIEKPTPSPKALPVQPEPAPLPITDPTPRDRRPEKPIYYNARYNDYYPVDVTNGQDIIRFRNNEYR